MLHDASTRSQVPPDVLEALAIAGFHDGVRWATQEIRECEEVLRRGDLMDLDKLKDKLNKLCEAALRRLAPAH